MATAKKMSRAAIGSHQQQAAVVGRLVEVDLVLDGDVAAEQQHVQAVTQGSTGLQGRVLARDGDQRQVGIWPGRHRGLEGRVRRLPSCPSRPLQCLDYCVDRGLSCSLAVGLHRDDQVVGTRVVGVRVEHPGTTEDRLVGLGPHHDRRLTDTGTAAQFLREAHEEHRVPAAVREDAGFTMRPRPHPAADQVRS